MEESNKKKKIITVLAIVTVAIYIGIFFIVGGREKERAKLNNVKIVTDYSEFYTVSAVANKYVTFLSARDEDSLINVLSDKFKKSNNITKSNILGFLPQITQGSTFAASRIYYEKMSDNTFKYYIKGFLETSGLEMDEISRTEHYVIVYLDKDNTLFSIEPYDGTEYKQGVFA